MAKQKNENIIMIIVIISIIGFFYFYTTMKTSNSKSNSNLSEIRLASSNNTLCNFNIYDYIKNNNTWSLSIIDDKNNVIVNTVNGCKVSTIDNNTFKLVSCSNVDSTFIFKITDNDTIIADTIFNVKQKDGLIMSLSKYNPTVAYVATLPTVINWSIVFIPESFKC